MKIELPIDTSAVSFIDVMPPEPVLDHKTRQQRSDANGEPLYSIELCCIGGRGGEVLAQVVETRSRPRFRSLARDCGWVSVRDGVKEALGEHLARYVAEQPDAVVFTDALGGPLVRHQFEEAEWLPALRAVGLPTEEMGVDMLGSARLWLDIKQARALRASYSAGWQKGGGIGA